MPIHPKEALALFAGLFLNLLTYWINEKNK